MCNTVILQLDKDKVPELCTDFTTFFCIWGPPPQKIINLLVLPPQPDHSSRFGRSLILCLGRTHRKNRHHHDSQLPLESSHAMIWVGLSSPMHSHARFITGQTTVTRRYLLSDLSTYYLLATIKQKHQLCSIFSDHERKAKMVSYIYAFDCVLCILLAVCHNYCY